MASALPRAAAVSDLLELHGMALHGPLQQVIALGSIVNTGAGMLNDWGTSPAIIPAREKRISDPARRVLVLRNWLEAMEEAKPSSYRDQQIFLTEPKLRDAAAFVIGWGC